MAAFFFIGNTKIVFIDEIENKIATYTGGRAAEEITYGTISNQYLGGDTALVCSAETQTEIDYEKETITGDEFMEILNK